MLGALAPGAAAGPGPPGAARGRGLDVCSLRVGRRNWLPLTGRPVGYHPPPVRSFGKYRLIEPLASGGMADVWRAEVTGAAGVVKEVARKLVRGEHEARSDFVRMFVEEARLASRLTHANVVQVFEFDQVDGRYYLAMERVHGHHLGRVVERARELGLRFGLPRAVHVGAEVAKALAYVHRLAEDGRSLGLVHRDVSPHNLLVSFEGEVKLADFGIARAMSLSGLTEPGTLKGKLSYMAPEQARGEPVDGRADVFALGVVLWELCAGRRLFQRDSEAATLAALLEGPPPSPPSAWNEEVPPELDAVLLGALERDPARRVRSAEELAAALGAVILRIARSPEDWDLRAVMGRLWPEGAAPPPGPRLERTRVRAPVLTAPDLSPAAPPAFVPEGSEPTAATRTLVRRHRWRPVPVAVPAAIAVLLAVVAALRLALAGAGGAPARSAPRVAAPPAAVAPKPPARGIDGGTEVGVMEAASPGAGNARRTPAAGEGSPAAPVRGSPAEAERPPGPERLSGPDLRGAPPAEDGAGEPGVLQVNATPWAYVTVDGQGVGETPVALLLSPGRHRVRAAHPSYGIREATVEVATGRRTSWHPNLTRR